MADEEPAAVRKRRARGQETDPARPEPTEAAEGGASEPDTSAHAAEEPATGSGKGGQERVASRRNGTGLSAAAAARRAGAEVAALTHRRPEAVTSIERVDGQWRVGIEVVETQRIPDTADILAIYEVQLGPDGELTSYRRVKRYERGQLHQEYR